MNSLSIPKVAPKILTYCFVSPKWTPLRPQICTKTSSFSVTPIDSTTPTKHGRSRQPVHGTRHSWKRALFGHTIRVGSLETSLGPRSSGFLFLHSCVAFRPPPKLSPPQPPPLILPIPPNSRLLDSAGISFFLLRRSIC